ncbi:MAG: hypothetical protein CVU61_14440 [Deltaproteobacteria bacterium HGW-Deltaproteobacteria-19]|jgi:hypothetical protein|nr:MAG: hypothetical protein CVU61_14440 [Deltaproteobacteria bacterium HGW-Deltaproteobacteria-19]
MEPNCLSYYEEKIKISLRKLYEKDFHLIVNDLNERTIAHRLACYIQEQFDEYNVDCEYNGNAEHPDRRKLIDIMTRQGQTFYDEEEHCVYPDIIVHKRKVNEYNELIIEMKKSTNTKCLFDYDKLIFYTDKYRNTYYPYKYGCFIKITTSNNNIKQFALEWYKDGKSIKEELVNLSELD